MSSASLHQQQTLQELESLLDDYPQLSGADRGAVMREVHAALDRIDGKPQPFDVDRIRDQWLGMIDSIGGDMDASDREDLVRRIDQSLDALRKPAFMDAVEYERRRRVDGEAPAAEWLAGRNKERQREYAAVHSGQITAVLRNDVALARRKR